MADFDNTAIESETKASKRRKLAGPDRLQYARDIIIVARTLTVLDKRMTYGDLARVIGLLPPDEKWYRGYGTHISNLLYLAAAVEREGSGQLSEYERFFNAATGKPGPGIRKHREFAAAEIGWESKRRPKAGRQLASPVPAATTPYLNEK